MLKKETDMFYYIEFLRAIATVLIVNSHFKGVYPSDVLSFGGGLGLALFYMISGHLLTNINNETRFIGWYWKKIVRLYIPLYIVRIIEMIVGKTTIISFGDFFMSFIFPGTWFGGSMVILYVIYFLFVKYIFLRYKKKSVIVFSTFLVLGFAIFYVLKPSISTFSLEKMAIQSEFSIETPYLITQLIWMLCMLLGLYLKRYSNIHTKQSDRLLYLGSSIVFVALFMCTKILIKHGGCEKIQFLLPISYVGFSYSIFVCFMSNEALYQKIYRTTFGKLLGIISACSLEIYYTQFFWISKLKEMVFPLNLVALFIMIMLTAYIVHVISNWIIKKINNLSKQSLLASKKC
jgi:hypothetical protein